MLRTAEEAEQQQCVCTHLSLDDFRLLLYPHTDGLAECLQETGITRAHGSNTQHSAAQQSVDVCQHDDEPQ